jgi:hypothetical protein
VPLWTSEFVYEISGWRGIIHAANIIMRFVQKMDTLDVPKPTSCAPCTENGHSKNSQKSRPGQGTRNPALVSSGRTCLVQAGWQRTQNGLGKSPQRRADCPCTSPPSQEEAPTLVASLLKLVMVTLTVTASVGVGIRRNPPATFVVGFDQSGGFAIVRTSGILGAHA